MIASDQINRLNGATVLDADGHKVGFAVQAFVDATDGRPRWVTVRTGRFGHRESFVPLAGADLRGDELRIPYSKATVSNAPRMDTSRPLSTVDEDALSSYYRVGGSDGEALRGREAGAAPVRTSDLPPEDEELPEERSRVAAAPPAPHPRRVLAETVMEFPEDDDQIRRSQIDFDGEAGRDRV